MKAFLLAAGLGTRLKPITENLPKCLAPIAGQPLLKYWLNLFKRNGIYEVLLNLHHFPEKVQQFIQKDNSGIVIRTFFEENLLGSAGTVKANKEWIGKDEVFVIAYADNLTNVNLRKMISWHSAQNSLFTMGLFHAPNPEECGIAILERSGMITEFYEKPENPKSDLANAGLYIASNKLFDYIPEKRPADFGFDVLPKLVGKMKGYIIEEYLLDIGTLQNYQRAQMDAHNLNLMEEK